MTYLLDTNVLSDVRRQAYPPLNAWFADQVRAELAISVVSVLEIEQGVLQLERRDVRAAQHIRAWFEGEVLPAFAGRVLPVDQATALRAARFHVPDPMPQLDALIAATAAEHDLTLVTRNVRDFARTGVRLLNPWELL